MAGLELVKLTRERMSLSTVLTTGRPFRKGGQQLLKEPFKQSERSRKLCRHMWNFYWCFFCSFTSSAQLGRSSCCLASMQVSDA